MRIIVYQLLHGYSWNKYLRLLSLVKNCQTVACLVENDFFSLFRIMNDYMGYIFFFNNKLVKSHLISELVPWLGF